MEPAPFQEKPAASRAVRKEVLLVCLDLLVFYASTLCALHLRFGPSVPAEHGVLYAYLSPLLLMWRLVIAYRCGLYDFRRRLSLVDHAFAGCSASAVSVLTGYLVLTALGMYYVPEARLSRTVVILDFILLTAWYTVSRGIVIAWLRAVGYEVRVAIVGTDQTGLDLAEEIVGAHSPFLRVVLVECPADKMEELPERVAGAVTQTSPCHLVLCGGRLPQTALQTILAACDVAGVEVFLYPDLDLLLFSRVSLTTIAGIPLLPFHGARAFPRTIMKRAADIALSAVLLAATCPLWIAAAAAVRCSSRGPVFYCQERVGLNGRCFRLWKFRTMRDQAEDETGAVLASVNDPRITRVGRVLRRFRLDELPQLALVLAGTMSLVGPRPERPEFVETFTCETPFYAQRLAVRPGLTGLSQVHSCYDADYRRKLRYDLVYVNGHCLSMDLRILLATIRTVVTGRGAL